MFGKKKTKSTSAVKEMGASRKSVKGSDMTSGSRSTKSCSAKSSSAKSTSSKACGSKACHSTKGASSSETKSCS